MTNLSKKKALAAKTLNVGKGRIIFIPGRMDEIKDAITKQDIRDLNADGAIKIREIKGRKKVVKRKVRRGPGKVRKKVNKRKQEYVIITRKLRSYSKKLKDSEKISTEQYKELRKGIRNRDFDSLGQLKDSLKVK